MRDDFIASLALLKVNWDKRKDYIENFVPFAAECLRLMPSAATTSADLQAEIVKRFGFKIPQEALKTILHRAAKRGYVYRKDRRYLKNQGKLNELNFARSQNEALRRTKALVKKLQSFAATKYSTILTDEEAELELFSYLKHNSEQLGLLTDQMEASTPPSQSRQVVANAFVVHVVNHDPEGYDYLETVYKGAMLANALFFPSLSQIGQRFQNVSIYLDSNVLLMALGLAGEALADPYRELIDLARELGSSICCFEDTADEIRRYLTFVVVALRDKNVTSDGFSSILEHCLTTGVSPSDIEILSGNLEKELQKLGVSIRRKPSHSIPLSVAERKLEILLRESMEHRTEEALHHDVDCLTAVHRLRDGQRLREIETCRALFVSTSQRLSQISAQFFEEHFGNTTAPHCMTAQTFTTIVWLKKPVRAQDLPMKRLVADCYAALNPSDSLWNRYRAELERLRKVDELSEDDYYQLRFSIPARSALMDLTAGNIENFDSNRIPEILERTRANAKAGTQIKLEREQRKLLAVENQLNTLQRKADKAEEDVRTAKERAEQAELAAEQARAALRYKSDLQDQKITNLSSRLARLVSKTALLGCTAATGMIVYFTSPRSLARLPEGWQEFLYPLVPLAFFVSGVFTLLNWSFGASINQVTKRLEARIEARLQAYLRSLVSPD